jgi:hypothetical protein
MKFVRVSCVKRGKRQNDKIDNILRIQDDIAVK